MGEPKQMTGRDYLRPHTSRDDRGERIRLLRRENQQPRSVDDMDLNDEELKEVAILSQREMQETPPLCTNGRWQTFRSPKTAAFPKPQKEYVLKDYMHRDVTHRFAISFCL